MFANADELLKYIKDEGVEMIDVRFCDLPGVMQHFTVPTSSFDQSVFDDGRYTAEDWLRIYAAHAHGHASQIRRLREALQA